MDEIGALSSLQSSILVVVGLGRVPGGLHFSAENGVQRTEIFYALLPLQSAESFALYTFLLLICLQEKGAFSLLLCPAPLLEMKIFLAGDWREQHAGEQATTLAVSQGHSVDTSVSITFVVR